MKPQLFIGSSSEGLAIANAIQEHLDDHTDCTVWNQGIFSLSTSTMESLLDVLQKSDFGVFVLSPDDIVRMRGSDHISARDNVVFEVGLFVGRLGLSRTFLVHPRTDPPLHLPSDLLGITTGQFRTDRQDDNLPAALGPVCNRMRKAIESIGPKQPTASPSSQTERLYHQVAALCYKFVGDSPQILLIKTSEKRWMFPKGGMRDSGELWRMAASEAHDEAGVTGEVARQAFTTFRHRKGYRSRDMQVVTFLLHVKEQFEPFELRRDPTWFDEAGAERALSKGRDYELAQELKDVLSLALDEIRNLG